MKILFYIILVFTFTNSFANKPSLKVKLNSLKKQTVQIHNEILNNNQELQKIKIDIDRNTQKKIIFNKYIKDKDLLGRRIIFLLQDKFYTNQFTRISKNLNNSSEELITKQIIREYFLKEVKTGISEYFVNLENLKSLDRDLIKELENYKSKKKLLSKKLKKLEKKIKEVAKLQKKVKPNEKLKIKAKKLRQKAKNLNDLVKATETKRKIISGNLGLLSLYIIEIILEIEKDKILKSLNLIFPNKIDNLLFIIFSPVFTSNYIYFFSCLRWDIFFLS